MTGGDTSKYEREIKRKELRKWRRKDRKKCWNGNHEREKGEGQMKKGKLKEEMMGVELTSLEKNPVKGKERRKERRNKKRRK